jgi:hypothetical protein
MVKLPDFSLVIDLFDRLESTISHEHGDKAEAVIIKFKYKALFLKYLTIEKTVSLYISDETETAFSNSSRRVPIELTGEIEGHNIFEMIDECINIDDTIDMYSQIVSRYAMDYFQNKKDFEQLVLFNKGFNCGYYYNMLVAASINRKNLGYSR